MLYNDLLQEAFIIGLIKGTDPANSAWKSNYKTHPIMDGIVVANTQLFNSLPDDQKMVAHIKLSNLLSKFKAMDQTAKDLILLTNDW